MTDARTLPLGELLEGTKILRTGGEPDILAVRPDPHQIAHGNVFFKLRSSQFRTSASVAIGRGAGYVVLEAGDEEEAALPPDFPYAVVDDVNRAYARTCSRLFGEAHRQLTLIGVTGAKGKTTVCHLIDAALRASGIRSGLVSSLVFRLPDSESPTAIWAPDTLSIHSFLAAVREQGGTHAVIELASLAIAEDRLYGLQFDAFAFTNHDAGDAQMAVNRRLLTDPGFHKSSMICAFNGDDPAGRELARSSPGRVVTFGFGAADVTPEFYASDRAGISMRLDGHDLRFPLIGRHNAANVLAAAAIIGGVLPSEGAAVHLQNVQPLPGRLERLPASAGIDVYLDQPYMPAHIEASLAAVREFAGSRRIVCVIGGVGGVDKALRPLRVSAAVHASDFCILAIDDPRDEHPGAILMDMLRGVRDAAPDRWKTVMHRPTAIATAIREASPDGIVVLMGKRANGAELRNDDRHVALDALHGIRSSSTEYTSV